MSIFGIHAELDNRLFRNNENDVTSLVLSAINFDMLKAALKYSLFEQLNSFEKKK